MKITHLTSSGMKLIAENPDDEIKHMMLKKVRDSFICEIDHLLNRIQVEIKELKKGEKKKIISNPIVIDIEQD